jgi:hypothetical protein
MNAGATLDALDALDALDLRVHRAPPQQRLASQADFGDAVNPSLGASNENIHVFDDPEIHFRRKSLQQLR